MHGKHLEWERKADSSNKKPFTKLTICFGINSNYASSLRICQYFTIQLIQTSPFTINVLPI